VTTPTAYDWTMKRGDLLPSIRAQLGTRPGGPDGDLVPTDLTDMTACTFVMVQVDAGGTPKTVEGAAHVVEGEQPDGTVLTPADGWVEYDWLPGDTDTVGDYEAEWETRWGTKPQTFPQETVHTIRINPDRGGV
jgi:hypothetical protein